PGLPARSGRAWSDVSEFVSLAREVGRWRRFTACAQANAEATGQKRYCRNGKRRRGQCPPRFALAREQSERCHRNDAQPGDEKLLGGTADGIGVGPLQTNGER